MSAKHTFGPLVPALLTDKRHKSISLMAPAATDVAGHQNVLVASCSAVHVYFEEAQANADRIALCWNAHDKMKKLLMDSQQYLIAWRYEYADKPNDAHNNAQRDRIDATLKRYEELLKELG